MDTNTTLAQMQSDLFILQAEALGAFARYQAMPGITVERGTQLAIYHSLVQRVVDLRDAITAHEKQEAA